MYLLLIFISIILILVILKYVFKFRLKKPNFFKILKSKPFLKLFGVSVFITLILGMGTQKFAKLVKFHSDLGTPVYKNLYNPYSIIIWFFRYENTMPNILNRAIKTPSLIFSFISLIIFIRILRKDNKKDTHGSARWIKNSELEKLGYLKSKYKGNDGVILGRVKTLLGEKTVIDNKNTHISVIAPTRSGKGVGIIIPTLLTWKGSTFVLDPKGENFALTSGYRQKVLKHKVLKFAPFATEGSISFNPLSNVRRGHKLEFKDVEVITSILVDNGKEGELDHWASGAKVLLNGIILHVLYTIKDRTASLGDVIDFMTSPANPLADELLNILGGEDEDENEIEPKYIHGESEFFKEIYDKETMVGVPSGVHPIVARMCAEMSGKADKERASIISTATTKISLFQNPVIRQNTKKIDFKINDLMNYETPVDLFICIQPEDIKILAPLVRLLLTQVVGTLCPEMNYETREAVHKHKMLLLLDEFPAFGKIPILEKGIAYIAGYGMKALLIGQSLSQYRQVYGRDISILDNCATAVFYTPSPIDTETPKIISNLLGKTTIKVKNTSQKVGQMLGGNISNNSHGRELMTEEEVRNKLGDKRNIISIGGEYPIKGWKIRFYEEPYFLDKTNKTYGIPKTDRLYK
ncbi:type IV secretory system conjugative DNA transfer family protein [Psychrilyobacter sp.]|uniref:type IV secretory system conjugative DNA transfer family protein n=1 Tax=Psychrilyobacter sp. TaxID=2586924 RepID=UPI003016ABEC